LADTSAKNEALSGRWRTRDPVTRLLAFDRRVCRGARIIAGVDEAGRGPLAGPVVAAVVAIEPGVRIAGVNDSKKLTPPQREELFDDILRQAAAVSWACVGEQLIDSTDILRASILAMTWSVETLSVEPGILLVDGPYRLPVKTRQEAVIGGDGLSLALAAASVVAKVTRDRMMVALDHLYPQYFFKANKGYPTQAHLEALSRHGPCPVHRLSFGPVRRWAGGS
jgi:ribonuclease HII